MEYKIRFVGNQKSDFVRIAKKHLADMGKDYAYLSKVTGFTEGSIKEFFSDKRPQGFMAAAIADVLKIKRSEW
jgi:hypothetical protein